ncbi:MAG: PTS lactose/cellobiose transporter subunit IIA, partial [Tetragenococcus sp.]|nr:PTS lactose/cellobiose transporter subunit IIA [Tetragenococcus sp.]
NMDIIMVHAQDHLMTTITLREVALEMLSLYKSVKSESE